MKRTISDELASDPRVIQAKRQLLDVLVEYQERIKGIRPPDPDLRVPYDAFLKEFGDLRGGALFFPYLGSGLGNGVLVELADGSVKYDFISGIGVHHWGHSHPAIVEALLNAAMRDTVMQGNLQQNVESVSLARTILSAANRKGAELGHCFFSTSGAMANENALKIIFQKKYPADRILAFEGCFMGRTLALSQITDKAAYRECLPPSLSVDYVPFFDPARPDESIRAALDCLERYLARYPGKHAAMCIELVLGEGGFHPGTRDFFLSLIEVLRQHQVAIMVDEIQTFSRTTELFAYQYFGLDDYVDVVTIGKSSQVCATLFRDEFKPRPGLLSQTFTGSTSALFAAEVIIRGLIERDFFGPDGRIAKLHDHFETRLKQIQERLPGLIAGPFGIGAMIAFTPFNGDHEKVVKFVHALFDAGVISFYAGSDLSRVRFLLPVAAVTFDDIDAVCAILERTLRSA
ncbi:MAG: aminotransferase class III-fold pyridoxal phosphate-dependent enzyme [Desulfomonile tiedjei]|nr:aminotransferase class III-fold pyridoxal phosphate-dependent enzyme [Desulfomonile tiedjei]